jgi:hypothetical protein
MDALTFSSLTKVCAAADFCRGPRAKLPANAAASWSVVCTLSSRQRSLTNLFDARSASGAAPDRRPGHGMASYQFPTNVESEAADRCVMPRVAAGVRQPRPSLTASRHATNVDVEVQGIDDPLLVAQIANAMPHLFHHLVGTWAVDVRPSDEYGRWLLGLHGAFGRHVWSFTSAPPDLPQVIAGKLSAFFRAAAAAYQPPSIH